MNEELRIKNEGKFGSWNSEFRGEWEEWRIMNEELRMKGNSGFMGERLRRGMLESWGQGEEIGEMKNLWFGMYVLL